MSEVITRSEACADVTQGAAVVAVSPANRIISVDALRGFDMFWIIGIDEVVWAAEDAWPSTFTSMISLPLKHCEWDGFNFYDLVFPLFIFLAGVSIVLSFKSNGNKNWRSFYWRIFRRFSLLFLLGIFYYFFDSGHVRITGVLQRIAVCYLVTSLLFRYLRLRGLVIVFFGILISYWALLTFVTPPGELAPTFKMGHTWPNYIDLQYLPMNSRGRQGWSNEGYLSTVPAIATCLLGVFAGLLIKNGRIDAKKKTLYLVLGSVLLLVAGYGWGLQFPIIKRIWTSTYVLVAGGYSCFLLGLFYLIIDVYQRKKWAMPLLWIGSNSITAYLICGMFPWWIGLDPLDSSLQSRLGNAVGVLNWSIITVGVLLITYFLHRKKLFLRV